MSKLFEDTMLALIQAVAIEKGYIPVEEVPDMPAKTFRFPEDKNSISDTERPKSGTQTAVH